jgi:hypothetical protein
LRRCMALLTSLLADRDSFAITGHSKKSETRIAP